MAWWILFQQALNNVVYKPFTQSTSNYLERYIKGFAALNLRSSQRDDDFKYERVALIIADFSQNPVKVYNSTQELIEDNLLPVNSIASMDNLSYNGFVRRLLDVYEQRFGLEILSWYLVIRKSSISCLSFSDLNSSISSFENWGMVNFSIKFFW